MPKRKADIEVGKRAVEEIGKIFDISKYGGITMASKAIGCSKNSIYEWEKGATPETIFFDPIALSGCRCYLHNDRSEKQQWQT